jgi:hypothetical protein
MEGESAQRFLRSFGHPAGRRSFAAAGAVPKRVRRLSYSPEKVIFLPQAEGNRPPSGVSSSCAIAAPDGLPLA